jgi:cytochrome c oxidase assembly factor CtaG
MAELIAIVLVIAFLFVIAWPMGLSNWWMMRKAMKQNLDDPDEEGADKDD